MPRVPTYDAPQVEPRALPGVRQSSVASPELFGTAARQQMAAGQALLNTGQAAANIATQMQDRENADMLFRAETALKDEYLKYEADVRNRRGQQAWGATRDTEKWFADQEKKHGEALTNDVQRRLFTQSMSRLRQQAVGTVSAYEAGERRRSLEESASASIVGSINQAAALASDGLPSGGLGPDGAPLPSPVGGLKTDILKRVQVLSDINGWTPERKAAEEEKHLTNLHTQVIQNLAVKSPAKAREYYEVNRAEVAGAARNTIESALKEGGLRETAQAFGDAIQTRKMGMEEALAEARQKYSGEEEVAVVQEVKTRFAEANATMVQGQTRAANEAWKVVTAGGGRKQIPLKTWNELTGQDQRHVLDYLDAKAKGGGIKTDIATWMEVNDGIAAGTIRDSRDLMRYASRISGQDMQEFANKMTRPDRVVEAKVDTDDFNHIATLAGLTPFDAKKPEQKAALGDLRYKIEQLINQAQQTKKGPLSRDEKMALMQREVDNKVMVDAFGRDPAKPALALGEDEQRRAYVNVGREQVYLKAIPAAERQKIIEARRRAGLPVSEQAIADFWVRAGKPGSK